MKEHVYDVKIICLQINVYVPLGMDLKWISSILIHSQNRSYFDFFLFRKESLHELSELS